MATLSRVQAWLAGLWAGIIVATGAIAAPSAFMVLDKPQAGQIVGRVFTIEAFVSLGLAMLLFLMERRRFRDGAPDGGSVLSMSLLLILGALFLTVFGQFALRPMMDAARAGQGMWSFGTLHGVSALLFWAKAGLVLSLAWRATGTLSATATLTATATATSGR